MSILVDDDATDGWASLGLSLHAEAEDERLWVEQAPWIEGVSAELATLPPLGVILDLGRALFHRDRVQANVDAGRGPVADARARYREHFFGRLLADRRLEAARDAVALLSPHQRTAAVIVVVDQILSRTRHIGAQVNAAKVRRIARRQITEISQSGFSALQDDESAELICAGYDALVSAARRTGALLADADLVALENLEALRSRAARFALTQVADAAQELERLVPRRIRRTKRVAGHHRSNLDDENTYPIGGYSSMSTNGTIENLVSSELAYMEPDGKGVDLFDVRWASGELLYYTRDESVFHRAQHHVTVLFSEDLTRARVRDPGSRYQRIVLALAGTLVCVRRLAEILEEDALKIRLVFPDIVLDEERALAELVFATQLSAGIVEIVVEPIERALEVAAEREKVGESRVIFISSAQAPPAPLDAAVALESVEGIAPFASSQLATLRAVL